MRELTEHDKALLIDSIPSSELVLFCPGLQGRSATLLDRSQNANHGTISGGVWKRLPSGLWTIDMDLTNDLVTFPDATSLRVSAFTANIWVKFDNSGVLENHYLFTKRLGVDPWQSYGIFCGWNEAVDARVTIDGTGYSTSGYSISDTNWHMLTATFDSPNLKIYTDGTLRYTKSDVPAGTLTLDTTVLQIGGDSPWQAIGGLVAIPLLYNTDIGATEIARLFTRQRHLFGV